MFFRDIKTEKEKASALRWAEIRYENIFNNIPDMVFRFDTSLRHIFINRAGETFFGIRTGYFSVKNLLSFVDRCAIKEQNDQQKKRHIMESLKINLET